MNKKQKQETVEIFAETFREVVLPELEKLDQKIEGLDTKMATKEDIDRIIRKLDSHDNRMDRQGKLLENHEERLIKLEKTSSIAS